MPVPSWRERTSWRFFSFFSGWMHGKRKLFGINVFKGARSHAYAAHYCRAGNAGGGRGMVSLRGVLVPVIDLASTRAWRPIRRVTS